MWSWFSPAVVIINAWLFVSSVMLHFVTAFSDPGIIPRKVIDANREENPFRSPPMTKTILVNGTKVQMKFCKTCNIFRPPRAVHCGVCDNCVDRFDHHW